MTSCTPLNMLAWTKVLPTIIKLEKMELKYDLLGRLWFRKEKDKKGVLLRRSYIVGAKQGFLLHLVVLVYNKQSKHCSTHQKASEDRKERTIAPTTVKWEKDKFSRCKKGHCLQITRESMCTGKQLFFFISISSFLNPINQWSKTSQ